MRIEESVRHASNCSECGISFETAFKNAMTDGRVLCNLCYWGEKISEIEGVGKDAPTITTETGGKHSDSPYRFDLFDPKAMFEIAKVLHDGAEKYGEDNWRLIDTQAHLNHALVHIYAHLAGDRQDDHLSHAVCRTLFALAVEIAKTPAK